MKRARLFVWCAGAVGERGPHTDELGAAPTIGESGAHADGLGAFGGSR